MNNKITKTIEQFIKFGMVGLLNTLITISIIFIFMMLLNVSYILSNIIGYLFGFVNSFILNKIWTFKSKKPIGRESFFFVLIFAICYLLQLLLLIVLKENLKIIPEYAQLIAMGLFAVLNFSGNKFITFKN
ncbi:MAG: GtrA family protein [Candidatus Cloacimonadota bacterium]|nr:GtrA family protein [Candidatus Cloacimonadota bacterium]